MTARSSIYIHNLRIHAYHGVMPQETVVGGDFSVSLQVWTSVEQAAVTDQVEYTVNYADLCRVVTTEMQKPSKLIENVAWRIIQAVMEKFSEVDEVEVHLTKLNPPMGIECDGAGVTIKATR